MKDHSNFSDDSLLLKAFFEEAIDGIITINERGIVESINPAAARMFDYFPEEIIGKNIKVLMPEPYHGEHDGYLNNYKNTGERKIIGKGRKVMGRKKDGSTFPFFLSISEVKLKDRRVFAGVIHDFTDIDFIRRELEASNNRFKAIVETAVDGIIIINHQGLIQLANPAANELFGYSEMELTGNNISMLMGKPHKQQHDSYLKNFLSSGHAKIIGIGREVEGRKKDGTTFPFRLGVSRFMVGEDTYFAGIIHDLTVQKKAEKELLDSHQTLEQKVKDRTNELADVVNQLLGANHALNGEISEREKIEKELEIALQKEKELGELKSRFVSMASHEFRTPLSAIKSSASLIGKYTEGDQQSKRDKHIGKIKKSVELLTDILDDFLSVSKLEEGKIAFTPESVDWNDYVEEFIQDIQGLLKPGQVIDHLKATGEPKVSLDRKLFFVILQNLVSNAIKYSPEGGKIYMKSQVDSTTLRFDIIDEGIGIPKEDHTHLFTRFFRANNASNIQGTGLGLNIVKQYTEMMGGSVSFESEEGKGSTFTLQFPLNSDS